MRVGDLTVEELRQHIFETVDEALSATLDPDAGLEVRDEFMAMLEERLRAPEPHVSGNEARRRLIG